MAARNSDDFIAAVEKIHTAGLDAERWPQALVSIARLTGSVGGTLEVFERPSIRHRSYLAVGIPPAHQLEYLDHYAKLNVRLPLHAAAKANEVIWDYRVLDEAAMRHAPFYSFLHRCELRYFVSGIIHSTATEFAAVTVQRSPKQGHADRAGIALMARLVPHVRQAFDVSQRLRSTEQARISLERALDTLQDGVALIDADGAPTYANATFAALARRDDGVVLRKGGIELRDANAQTRFAGAIAAVLRLRAGDTSAAPAADVMVPRRGSAPPYILSVRPLLSADGEPPTNTVAIVFLRDPLQSRSPAGGVLREMFGLTDAETALAQALRSGVTPLDYARSNGRSLNTVYTHLRRLREKAGCRRLPELIHKLNELSLALRLD